MKHTLALVATLVLMASCSISYKFNGASINYDKVKTITSMAQKNTMKKPYRSFPPADTVSGH